MTAVQPDADKQRRMRASARQAGFIHISECLEALVRDALIKQSDVWDALDDEAKARIEERTS